MIDISDAQPTVKDNPHIELLDRVASGDYAAFATLYFDLHAPVQRFARMLVTDAADAHNVTSAVFVEMWHLARGRVSPPPNVARWALSIARRRCLTRRVTADRHIDCQLSVLLAAAGAREPQVCRCAEAALT